MSREERANSIAQSQGLADIQPSAGPSNRPNITPSCDPGFYAPTKISPADLRVIREKFPHLSEFSEEFLQSRTLQELLSIESTSVRSRDSERARESEDKLATNKANLATKYYDVPAGRDNRWSELHPARFMPGVACSAIKEYTTAREVIGLTSPPPVGCYDLTSVGMGGFVTARGWIEMGNYGSTKMKVGMFNLNNASKSSTIKSPDDDMADMKDVSEFELALRTMRVAAFFACPWNKAFVALENFMFNKKFFREELKHDSQPGRTLCNFTDFVLAENANHWRDGSGFLTTGELQGYWDAFVGARPQTRAQPSQQDPPSSQKNIISRQKGNTQKKKWPFVDICPKWNVGKCNKNPGSCFSANGIALRHVCNWRDFSVPNSQPCGLNHTRRGNH
jgi:hypothetical protein